ncbi:MAG: histidine kinase [Bacteroidia bacterium]|nr:histidine kinase [Bacteroidia bacterium]
MSNDLSTHPLLKIPIFQNRLLIHVIFWLSYVSFFAVVNAGGQDEFTEAFLDQLIMLPLKLAAVYPALYILIPRFLLTRKYWTFVFLIMALMLLAGLLQRAIIYYIIYPVKYPDFALTELEPFMHGYKIIRTVLQITYVLIFTSAIKITKYWYNDQQKARELVREKLEAELKFLKSQIHPHFLFNTLNNLYALSLKKSDHAPEVVLRLSGLVNYMLYDASAPKVPLAREIDSIHNYIALEKIRYGNNLDIFFDVTGNISGTQIAPMLLLPFIENGFKHGASDETDDKWITANLNVNNEYLTFKVENGKPGIRINPRENYPGGIGLQNVKRRLELLYPDRHELKIYDEESTFLVVLKIILE